MLYLLKVLLAAMACQMALAKSYNIQIKNQGGAYTMANEQTQYVCAVIDLDDLPEGDLFVERVTTQYEQEASPGAFGSHHAVGFLVGEGNPVQYQVEEHPYLNYPVVNGIIDTHPGYGQPGNTFPQGCHPDINPRLFSRDADVGFMFQHHDPAQRSAIPGYGIVINKEKHKRLTVQFHLDRGTNPLGATVKGNFGVMLRLTDQHPGKVTNMALMGAYPHELGLIAGDQPMWVNRIAVAANAAGTDPEAFCVHPTLNGGVLPELNFGMTEYLALRNRASLKIHAAQLHYHGLGRMAKLYKIDGGGAKTMIAHYMSGGHEGMDEHHDSLIQLPAPIEVFPNEKLVLECHYNSTGVAIGSAVFGGYGTDNEMCLAFIRVEDEVYKPLSRLASPDGLCNGWDPVNNICLTEVIPQLAPLKNPFRSIYPDGCVPAVGNV